MPSRMCSVCGASAMEEVTAEYTVEHNGQRRVFSERRMNCHECQNVSYVGAQVSEHELAVAAAIRDIDGLLSAEQLLIIRTKYKLKQTDLEQMLSTGPKTWTRWERGKVPQSKPADKLIRLMAEDPTIAHRLMEQAGVVNSDATAVFEAIAQSAKHLAHLSLKSELRDQIRMDNDLDAIVDTAFMAVDNARRQAAKEIEAKAA